MVAIAAEPDLGRMQRDRGARIQQIIGDQGIDALVLLGNSTVAYATGARWPLTDPGRANIERPVAVVVAGDRVAHLFTPYRTTGVPEDHLHGPVYLEVDEGAEAFRSILAGLVPAGARIAVDELPASLRRVIDPLPSGADEVIGAAKATKTDDELGFMREGLRITEEAITAVQPRIVPGVKQSDLTAHFLHRAFELGADANILDPIWQVMPAKLADGPWTTHGGIACPLNTTERELVEGEVLWVDTGISYAGFSSDFGRTWVVGRDPDARQRAQYDMWRTIIDAVLSVTKAGATGGDLTAAALSVTGGTRPWMEHFYLGHGLGIDSAEPPYIGTDLGDAYDARITLQPGTVLVLEPLVWDDGAAGYRAEEVVVVTDDGYIPMTDYPYDPYGD